MDSNGKYIIFKETCKEFIDNILTLNKNNNIYKDTLINKLHDFYIDYPILGWNNTKVGFEIDTVDISKNMGMGEKFTDIDKKVKLKKETTDPDNEWAGTGSAGSNNNNLNTSFSIGTEYFINQIDEKTIKLDNGDNTIINPSLTLPVGTDIYTDIASRIKLSIVSKPVKRIENDDNTEVLNIQNISNIRVKINVIAEDKIVKNTYTYIIQI